MQTAIFCIFLSAGDLKAPYDFKFIRPNLCTPLLIYKEMICQPDPVTQFLILNKIMFSIYKINTLVVSSVFRYTVYNKAFLQGAYVNSTMSVTWHLHRECAFQHV